MADLAPRYAAVVGACSYQLDFTRILCVVGPFATEAEARAAGEAESEALSPQNLQDDESSIEFDVVVMKESAAATEVTRG
jgi:hypothetical protein